MAILLMVGLYLASILPNIFTPFAVIFGILSGIMLMRALILSDGMDECDIPVSETLTGKWFKRTVGAFLISLFLVMLMPDKETIYLMVGVGVGSQVVEDVGNSETFGSVQELIELELKNMIEEKKKSIGDKE